MPQITALRLAWVEKSDTRVRLLLPGGSDAEPPSGSVETVRATLRISAPAAPSDPGGPRASKEATIGRVWFGPAEPARFDSRAAVRVLRARAGDLRARETQSQPRRPSIVSPGIEDQCRLRSEWWLFSDRQLGYV